MIRIEEKSKCCGCTACSSVCPRHCISMKSDSEGFSYPDVNFQNCINCGLCEKICPYMEENTGQDLVNVIAAFNTDDNVRFQSSSGGVFSALASYVIQKNGVIIGASFTDNWEVRHTAIHSSQELEKLLGSKYVQSDLDSVLFHIKQYLTKGKIVLFSGTPCQISGLKHYLRKDYPNLICVAVVCHGVASPKIWLDYLHAEIRNYDKIANICFRDKRRGWREYGFSIKYIDGSEFYETKDKNLYLKGYLTNTFLRPSCYNCTFKSGRSCADIEIGDYWGVQVFYPKMKYERGVNLVLVYTSKGDEILNLLNIERTISTYDNAAKNNPMIYSSIHVPDDRNLFWEEYENYGLMAVRNAINRRRPNFLSRMNKMCKMTIRRFTK